jgi:hypothetical protein
MIHYFSFCFRNTQICLLSIFVDLLSTLLASFVRQVGLTLITFFNICLCVLCSPGVLADFTCLQHTINNLEEGRMAHLSSNNNVQYSVSDEVWGNFVCRHVEQIRTAARDGDRAVGVNRTVAVEFHPSPSNQISQYQMFS